MLSVALGPFALAIDHLLLLGALALATLVGWLVGRRRKVNPERSIFGLFLIGVLVARLGFVLAYWSQYQRHPLNIIDIRDGGFLVWPGLVAILVGTGVWSWTQPALRKPLGTGVASGLLFWWLAGLGMSALHADARLPDMTVLNAAGEPVHVRDFQGKPLVVNLWATWCPPCRREMPVLQAAQQANPRMTFLFINQGETPRDVATFFASQGLHLDNVLFDVNGQLAKHVGSAALPTTLFYGPDGRLSGTHMGELSSASLTHSLDAISEPPPSLSRSTQ